MFIKTRGAVLCLRWSLAAILATLPSLFIVGCPSSGGGGAGALSGTYESKTPEGSWTLEFKGGNKVQMTTVEKGAKPESVDADYLIDGNKVTIQAPGGFPLVLTRNGNVLEGSVGIGILHFTKK
jgi:hypothetical protein